MRPAVDFREVRPGDVQELASRMRAADREECRACGCDDPRQAVQMSVDSSTRCWAIDVNGQLVAIFGVASCGTVLSPAGAPWLLGTDEMLRHKRALVRHVAPYIALMLRLYPHLRNVVHARNHAAVRWLRRVGFVLHEAIPVPPHGELFHPFEMKA